MPTGTSRPPPTKPPAGEIGTPEELNSVTELLKFVIQTFPAPSIAIPPSGWLRPPPVKPPAGDNGAPEGANSVTRLPPRFATQTSPEPPIAIPIGSFIPPPVKFSASVQSAGAALSAGEYGPPEAKPKMALVLFTGFLLMLMIAPSVSKGAVGRLASANRFVHCDEAAVARTQLASAFASVSSFDGLLLPLLI